MSNWCFVYEGWVPEEEPLREALCTLGNGCFATRGAAEEASAGGAHYPGTYIAGGYNRATSEVAGRVIENEDLVNWPNWLCLTFRAEDDDWFDLAKVKLVNYQQELDLKRGTLARRILFRDDRGRETSLATRRFVHMSRPHLGAIEWVLTPVNWSGRIDVRSGLDGTVTNSGVKRYRELTGKHLEPLAGGRVGEDGIDLLVQSTQSRIQLAEAARTRVFVGDRPPEGTRRVIEEPGLVAEVISFEGREGEPIRIEKVAALYSSRDHAIAEPRHEARRAIERAGTFGELLDTHVRAWERLWHRCDIEMADEKTGEMAYDGWAQLILRLHTFHLLQTVSPNTIDLDTGVPARGLHGEAYRGHIFWDELFIFPFLNLRIPEVTRALLMYRYRRLDEARRAARAAGYRGAMFPWQSGSDGREENQVVHLNPRSGRWLPDDTHLQRHVNSAIAYNVWQYYLATADKEFLSFYGAEMVLEIARFWRSVATYNEEIDRYEIKGVVGPDEYHTRYPGAEEAGLDNDAYTNVMAAWVCRIAYRIFYMLPQDRRLELLEELGISDEEVDHWRDISRKMYVGFIEDGIINQFAGYERLKEFDWEGYRKKYHNIHRLDRVLEAEGDSPNRYKCSKQADVLMLFYLFSARDIKEILESLGYSFDPEAIPRNVEYYYPRTSHGSTLSRVVDSWVLTRSDRDRSWGIFVEALTSDVWDIQGGTTPEGIHLGAMAGTVDLVQRCYAGVRLKDDMLALNPRLPQALKEIRLRIRYRENWLSVHVTQTKLTVSSEEGNGMPLKIGFKGKIYPMAQGDKKEFAL